MRLQKSFLFLFQFFLSLLTFGEMPSDKEDVDPNQNNQDPRELIENLYNEYAARNQNNQDPRELIDYLCAEYAARNQNNPVVISTRDLVSHLYGVFRNQILAAFKHNLNNSFCQFKQYRVDRLEDFVLYETGFTATEKLNDLKAQKFLLKRVRLPLSSSNNNNSLYRLISNSINNIHPALSNLFFENNNLIALVFVLTQITYHCKTPKDSNGSGSHGGSGAGGFGGISI